MNTCNYCSNRWYSKFPPSKCQGMWYISGWDIRRHSCPTMPLLPSSGFGCITYGQQQKCKQTNRLHLSMILNSFARELFPVLPRFQSLRCWIQLWPVIRVSLITHRIHPSEASVTFCTGDPQVDNSHILQLIRPQRLKQRTLSVRESSSILYWRWVK